MNRKVILGLGNLLRIDDGLGVHAIRALAGKVGDWELIDGGTLGLTLLPYLEGVGDLHEVLGLEPESLEWGTELSGAVQNALPLLLDQVLELVTFARGVAL